MTLVHLVAALWFVGVLAVVGWPISVLLASRGIPLPAPLAGLCVVPLWSWYWVEVTDGGGSGWEPGAPGRERSPLRAHPASGAATMEVVAVRSGALHGLAVLAAAAVICVVVFRDLFRASYLTTFSTGNNDVSNWLSHSQYLLDHGVRASTAFAGYDFPASFEREATFGAFSVLASAASVTGLATCRSAVSSCSHSSGW